MPSDEPDPRLVALGHALRRIRRERNLSQEAVALRAGVHPNHIGRVERGSKDVRVTTLLSLLNALEVSPGEIELPELGTRPTGEAAPPSSRLTHRSTDDILSRIEVAQKLLGEARTALETGEAC